MRIYKKIYTLMNLKEVDDNTKDLFNKFTSNKEIENELIYQDLKKYVKCLVNMEENENKIVEYIFEIENYQELDNEIKNKIDKIINNIKWQNNFNELLKYMPLKSVSFKEELRDE